MEKPNQITNDEIFSKMQSLRLTGYFQPIVNNDEDEPNNQARPGFNFRYGYWADAPAKFKLKVYKLNKYFLFYSLYELLLNIVTRVGCNG